ncbi:xylulokinase [Ruania alba]|uniref:xylulokinase n=1 Tax=Ruania alba TaxID=648782 RepID=UPI001587790B|nr:FGGY-family carbohydrate kinase [Ruania alba]
MLATTAPGAGGLRYLPYLSGSATPFWDDQARGTFAGFTESHGAGEFYRAVLEGLAFETKVLLDRLEVPAGRVEEIVVLGGGSASRAWIEILASVLNRPLAISATTEATALGAAILAASAVDLVPGGVAAAAESMAGVERRVQPTPELVAVYAPASQSYAQLYPALKAWFRS